MRVVLAVVLLGCSSTREPAPVDASTRAPSNVLSAHPDAKFCADHLADCEKQSTRCRPVYGVIYDEERSDGTRCIAARSKPLEAGETRPIVQCIPRDGSDALGSDQVVDPASGHCVAVSVFATSPRWSPCEDFMPVCEPTAGGKCIDDRYEDAGTSGSGVRGCFTPCDTAADCPAGAFCSFMGLFQGGDWECNSRAKVCRSEPLDMCGP
ncbi:MAG: hypothetical protein JNL79_30835 [Myxococcales bacterium]|nr:hypothetical protein [Myxococcales bacterium]